MLNQDSVSSALFIAGILAVAVALTGWVTLRLTNQRLKAERAIVVVQAVRFIQPNGFEIDITNIGVRAALVLTVSIPEEKRIVTGGLRSGDVITIGLPNVTLVDLDYRDATRRRRYLEVIISTTGGVASLTAHKDHGFLLRLFRKTGFRNNNA